MAQDRTRLIVRKTLEQVKGEHSSDAVVLNVLDAFAKRLDFNLNLAGIAQVTGRKPKSKTGKPADGKKD